MEKAVFPVERLDLLRKLSTPLGYSALLEWIEGVAQPKISPANQLHIPESESTPEYILGVRRRYFHPTMSLVFKPTDPSEDKVTIRARRQYISGATDQDIDLLSNTNLVWKEGIGNTLNLIPKGTMVRSSYEPSIATVESPENPLSAHRAEESLQKVALAIVETDPEKIILK